jgi:hypothetical protein
LPVVGRVDGGLAFNNTNTGINVPVAPGDDVFNWSVSDSFSIEFWMRTSSSTACSGGQVVVGRDGGLNNLHWWAGCSDGGRAAFYLRDTSGVLAGAAGTRNLTNGAWHHIVAVRDATATRIRIYVDGIEEGSTRASYAAGFGSPTAALNIGWINLSRQHHFEGTVDEVALYKRALYPNDIQQHYDKGQAGQGYCGE